jgi:hypothetical protein
LALEFVTLIEREIKVVRRCEATEAVRASFLKRLEGPDTFAS